MCINPRLQHLAHTTVKDTMYNRTICLFTYLGMGGAVVAKEDHYSLLVHRLRLLQLALQRDVITNVSHIHSGARRE
jgi:hypothetical protein